MIKYTEEGSYSEIFERRLADFLASGTVAEGTSLDDGVYKARLTK